MHRWLRRVRVGDEVPDLSLGLAALTRAASLPEVERLFFALPLKLLCKCTLDKTGDLKTDTPLALSLSPKN